MINKKFIIVKDTREKTGWDFVPDDYVEKTVSATVDTGDYTIGGMEDLVCIERKKSTGEFARNMVEKRFIKELERMQSFKYKFIICEFPYSDVCFFPLNSGLPPSAMKATKITANWMKYFVSQLQVNWGINVIFCDDAANAKTAAYYILRNVYLSEKTDD